MFSYEGAEMNVHERRPDPNNLGMTLPNVVKCIGTRTTASVQGSAYTIRGKKMIAAFFQACAEGDGTP